jgi:small subunit ribosomal protein S17
MVKTKDTKTAAPKGVPRAQVASAKADKLGKMNCKDRLCPKHGDRKLKMRGRVFQGKIVKVLPGRVSIEFERMLKLPKYERFEKRKTKIHARLPDCMSDEVTIGDLIEIAETRPISKMIHFVVARVVRKMEVRA